MEKVAVYRRVATKEQSNEESLLGQRLCLNRHKKQSYIYFGKLIIKKQSVLTGNLSVTIKSTLYKQSLLHQFFCKNPCSNTLSVSHWQRIYRETRKNERIYL